MKLCVSVIATLQHFTETSIYVFVPFQIGDFGLARNLIDDTYYKSSGGKIPVKWTSPEVK